MGLRRPENETKNKSIFFASWLHVDDSFGVSLGKHFRKNSYFYLQLIFLLFDLPEKQIKVSTLFLKEHDLSSCLNLAVSRKSPETINTARFDA